MYVLCLIAGTKPFDNGWPADLFLLGSCSLFFFGAKRTFCRGSPRAAYTARHFGKNILDPATAVGFLSCLKRQEPASVPTRSPHACRYGCNSISPAKRPGNRRSHNSFPPFCPDPAWCGLCSQRAPPAQHLRGEGQSSLHLAPLRCSYPLLL